MSKKRNGKHISGDPRKNSKSMYYKGFVETRDNYINCVRDILVIKDKNDNRIVFNEPIELSFTIDKSFKRKFDDYSNEFGFIHSLTNGKSFEENLKKSFVMKKIREYEYFGDTFFHLLVNKCSNDIYGIDYLVPTLDNLMFRIKSMEKVLSDGSVVYEGMKTKNLGKSFLFNPSLTKEQNEDPRINNVDIGETISMSFRLVG